MDDAPASPAPNWRPGIRDYLKRYFRNATPNKFVANPFTSGGIFEEDGHLRRKEKKVGFLELFYDLFFVAALSLFSRESSLTEGIAIGDYVVFVTILFSIWISQTYFDVRFSRDDGLTWLYSFLNLLVYGYIAASSGSFQISYGLYPSSEENESTEFENVPQYVDRVGVPEATDGRPIQVSLQAVSSVYAISRILLVAQYSRLFIMARSARKSTRAITYSVIGLLISSACFYGAMGASLGVVTRQKAIARIILWTVGLTVDFSGLILSSCTSKAIYYELEYWAERHAAVVLIVLGEGVIGLFENFRSVYTGPATGFRATLIGQIFAAVGIFRMLYAQYFVGAHSPFIRGGPGTAMTWGLLHLPFLLALLLLLRCVTNSLAATETIISAQIYVGIIDSIDSTVLGLVAGGISVDGYIETLQGTSAYPELVSFAGSLGIDIGRTLETYRTEANGDIQVFVKLYAGSIYSILARIFVNYDYDPSEESYNFVDRALAASDTPDYMQIFAEDVSMLIRPVYTSVAYGFTVLGGYLILLTALACLERNPKSLAFKIKYGYRFGLGIVMLILTTLDIGHRVTADNLLGRGTPSAPIYRLVASSTFTATIFLILFSVSLVDLVVYGVDAYRKDQASRGAAVPAVKRAEGRESSEGGGEEGGGARRGSFGEVNLERGERTKHEHEASKDGGASDIR